MIDIVMVGGIAACGWEDRLSANIATPHRIRIYPCDLAETEVLVGSPVTRAMVAQAPRLRLVHSSGAGFDSIDRTALPEGVPLCNVFHHERAMAEYVIMTMLAMDRRLFYQDRNLRSGIWTGTCVDGSPVASELEGRTLGIIGLGHIGREAARLASAFDMKILSLRSGFARAELESLLAESDYVLLSCPLSEQTRKLIGAAELAGMKSSAGLINVARGDVVDEAALYEALRSKRIRAAAIDVWYQYPRGGATVLPSRFPFQDLDNVIMTPHSSGWTERVVARRFVDIAANIDRLVAGEPLQNLVRA
ncbi:MAG: 2-hydroxyacid dehydrogenase [Bryobacteraceae bacterium]